MSKTGDSKLSRSEFMNRGMTKFTDIQKGYLKQYVGECIMNRFTNEESLLYLKDKLGVDLEEEEFEYLKEHSKKDLKRNIEYLRRHENAYIQEYFDRIEEMRLIAKRLWKLVEENPHNPILQKDCLSELCKSTIAKAGFYQSIRELDQEITTLKEEPEAISVSSPETKPAPPPEVEIPQQSSPKKIARYTSDGKPYMTEPAEGKPSMTEPAVLDWDRIIHKNVRSSDGQDAGNVDATYGDSVVIITEGTREEYKVPKSQVEGYNGSEVLLKLTAYELEKYRV